MNSSSSAIFKIIKNGYGPDTLHQARDLEHQSTKSTRLFSQHNFLVDCRKQKVTPSDCRVRVPPRHEGKKYAHRAKQVAENILVRGAANDARHEWRKSTLEENNKWTDLQHVLSGEDAKTLDVAIAEKCMKVKKVEAARRNSKLEWLISRVRPKQPTSTKQTDCVINLSKHPLSEAQRTTLSRGLNFAVAPEEIPTFDIISSVEAGGRRLAPEKLALWKNKIATAINKSHKRKVTPNLSPAEATDMATLRRNKDIKILKADKGGGVVVMDATDYDQKMRTLLAGDEYTKREEDPNHALEIELRKISAPVKKLMPPDTVPNARAAGVSAAPFKCPHIYGVPKVHKEGVPLRPIVSTRGSAFQPLARFLDKILRPLTEDNPVSIKNAHEFITKIKNHSPTPFDTMCSFDVKSLFTSVPREETLQIVQQKLLSDPSLKKRTPLSVPKICELVQFCMKATVFQYQEDFYEQREGLAMGNPLSPTLAEIFMQDLEEKCIASFGKRASLIVRYVDDYFILFNSELFSISSFLSHFNSAHPKIEFTMESENNKQLPFLDLSIKKSQNKFILSVYRKPTDKMSTLHFDSNHSFSTKYAVALNLFKRAFSYCTSEIVLNKEISTIQNILRAHNYPERVASKALHHAKNPPPALPPKPQPATTIVIPYVKGLSEVIRAAGDPFGVRTTFSTTNTLRAQLSKVKPKVPPPLTNVVYKIECADCNAVYIGQTTRQVQVRIREHERTTNKEECDLEAAAEDKNYSRLALHAKSKNHKIKWDSAKVIHREKNKWRREASEAMAMVSHRGNQEVISHPSHQLNSVWSNLIKKDNRYFRPKCGIPFAPKITPSTPARVTNVQSPPPPPIHHYNLRARNCEQRIRK